MAGDYALRKAVAFARQTHTSEIAPGDEAVFESAVFALQTTRGPVGDGGGARVPHRKPAHDNMITKNKKPGAPNGNLGWMLNR